MKAFPYQTRTTPPLRRWIASLAALSAFLTFLSAQTSEPALAPPGPSLKLVEKGSYLELPPDVFNDFTETTVEAWVKWNAFGNRYQRIFNYGEGGRDFGITTLTGTNTLWFAISDPTDGLKIAKVENTLKAGEWTHVAAVAGSGGMKLYVNGALVATDPYTGCFKNLGNGTASRLGQTVTDGVDDTPFDGELAEVRVWKTARPVQQIRDNMAKPLTGNEEGLAALWNFADPANPGRDASPNHHDGILVRAVATSGSAAAGQSPPPFAGTPHQVLQLDGDGSFVELPEGIFNSIKPGTIEVWVRWKSFRKMSRVFDFVVGGDQLNLRSQDLTTDLWLQRFHSGRQMVQVPGILKADAWVHLATVVEADSLKLYVNGVLQSVEMVADQNMGKSAEFSKSNFIGRSNARLVNAADQDFHGELDDLRVWNVVRTEEEIRGNLFTELTGKEEGLVSLWKFEEAKDGMVADSGPGGHHGKLNGNASIVAAARPASMEQVDVTKNVPATPQPPVNGVTKPVLTFSGGDSSMELPTGILDGLNELTLEAFVHCDQPTPNSKIITFGSPGGAPRLTLRTAGSAAQLMFGHERKEDDKWIRQSIFTKEILQAGKWIHIAAVIGSMGGGLYVDGQLVGNNPELMLSLLTSNQENRLGSSGFPGQLGEVRLWKVARSGNEIRDNLLKPLTGSEPGLVALWNFADPANPGRDASPKHHDGKLIGSARAGVASIAVAVRPINGPGAGTSMLRPPGDSNQVLQLDGEGNVETDAAVIPTAGDYTVECWAFASASARGAMRHLVAQDHQFYLGMNLQGEIRLGDSWIKTGVSYPFDGWHHIAVAKNSKGTELYIDGVVAARRDGLLPAPAAVATFRIGRQRSRADADWTERWIGSIDEVRVWNVARTTEQIRESITKQLTGSEPGLVGLWNFDDPANPGRDASPSHHDGKLVGNARVGEAPAGAAGSVKARPGGKDALVLDGSAAGITSESGSFAEVSDNFTMEFWALPTLTRGEKSSGSPGMKGQRYVLFPSQGTNELGGDPHAGTGVSVGTNGVAVVEHAAGHIPLVVDVQAPITNWVHVAVVYRDKTPSLYLNGTLAGTGPRSQRTVHPSLWYATSQTRGYGAFAGAVDDVRIWNVPLTEEQIRANLTAPITGNEPGLLGWWNFDDPTNLGRDASPYGRQVTVTAGTTSDAAGSAATTTVSGRITDAAGKPVRGAEVRVMLRGSAVGTAKAGEGGDYFLFLSLQTAPYRVLASLENLEGESAETEFVEGANKLDVTLRDTLSISGSLASPDSQPRRGVKVEGVGADGAVAKFSVSDAKGEFILRRLPDGEYKLRAAGVELNDGEAFVVRADAPPSDLKLTVPTTTAPERPPAENRVLVLDGKGQHVKLPVGMFGNLRETTIEAWVRFASLKSHNRFFSYGSPYQDLFLGQMSQASPELDFGTANSLKNLPVYHVTVPGVLEEGRWCHVALVIDARETRLYFNGTLAGASPKVSSFADLAADSPAYLGWWGVAGSSFTGGLDEVRVWAAARTGEEIRATLFQRLSGREEGLAGLWNFDAPDQPGRDATPNGFDGEMVQNAAAQPESLPAAATEITQWVRLSGATVDVDGRPLGKVKVRVERDEEHFDAETDLSGNFSILVRGSTEPWRVTATRGDLSSPPEKLVLDGGEHPITLKLRDAAPLSGHLRAPDGSPLPTVVVQALPVIDEGVPATMPGLVAEIFDIKKVTDFPVIPETTAPVLQRIDPQADFPLVKDSIGGGNTSVKTPFYARWKGLIRIGKGGDHAFHLAANDAARLFINGSKVVESIKPSGLSGTSVLADVEKSGTVTLEAGDHELLIEFYNNEGRDGLQLAWSFEGREREVVPPDVFFHERAKSGPLTVISDARGRFRIPKAAPGRYTLRAHVPGGFASWENGREVTVESDQQRKDLDFTLPPFKQGRWKTYTHENGLAADQVPCVFQAADGVLWFGTSKGVSRFDGRTFSSLPAEDVIPPGFVRAIEEDTEGRMWMVGEGGLFRYDPKAPAPRVRSFTTTDGLPSESVTTLTRDRAGRLWVGTTKGLSYHDPVAEKSGGKPFVSTVTEKFDRVKDLTTGARHGALVGAARLVQTWRPAAFPQTQPMVAGKVLQLDGNDSFVELPAHVFDELTEATVEGWVKWDEFQNHSRFFDINVRAGWWHVRNPEKFPNLNMSLIGADGGERTVVPGILRVGEWVHIAATITADSRRLYVNGVLVEKQPERYPMKTDKFEQRNYLGRSAARLASPNVDRDFKGQMDEVRVWKVARTAEEIRENLSKQLTGSEPGLVALWNFEDGTARDLTPNGYDGVMAGPAQIVEAERPVLDAAALVKETVLQLDGAGAMVELAPAGPVLGKTFTEEAWIFPSEKAVSKFHAFLGNNLGRVNTKCLQLLFKE